MVVVKFLIPNRAVTAAKSFFTNYSPLSVSRCVGIPYEMTELSANTVTALVDVTVVTGMALVSFLFRPDKKFSC